MSDEVTERPTFDELLPYVNGYYRTAEGDGGNLHIVIEDGNVEDSSIKWCSTQAFREHDAAGVMLGGLLLAASKRTRLRLHHDTSRYGGMGVGDIPSVTCKIYVSGKGPS